MTRIAATWVERESASGDFELEAAPDDIGWHEVYAAIAAANPFADIDEDSIEWEDVDAD